ncbi:uncharacterized protein LOC143680482 [Tamandua tetradactyla]|uniref:uncharacterized protein LOC143680482 n=1 Tax=Tamandua tetradactyla TaxID=48850 RepID=UPI00405388F7
MAACDLRQGDKLSCCKQTLQAVNTRMLQTLGRKYFLLALAFLTLPTSKLPSCALQTFEPPGPVGYRVPPSRCEEDPRRELGKAPAIGARTGTGTTRLLISPVRRRSTENAPQPIWIPGRNVRPATATKQAASPQNEKPSSPDCPDVPRRHTSAGPMKQHCHT